ncbi:MAG TPA: DUF1579 domain-containing protein [Phycisphaerales bacterium]|nr:DUF1579 domain-containing protein [Phycisphaerales bacterium]
MSCCAQSKMSIVLAAGLAGGMLIQASLSRSDAIQPESDAMQDSMSEYQNEMMEIMKLGQPGEHHKYLDNLVGDWNAHVEFYGPDGSVMAGDGTMTAEWVLDGRFVRSNFDMPDFMGAPFHGISYNGYDNYKQQYVSVWMDSMSTAIISNSSEIDGDQFITVGPNGHGGTMKIVSVFENDNMSQDTFYEQLDDGSWKKSGTITYTRK